MKVKQHARINSHDILVFFQQFSTLIAAGIPIIHACDLLIQHQQKIKFRSILRQIKCDLFAGKTLTQSLNIHTLYFSPLACHLIHVGETTGKLDVILEKLAIDLENRESFRQEIKQALFYPIILSLAGILTTFGMFSFIIPRFAALFRDKQNELPAITQLIFSFSAWMQQYGYLIPLPLILIPCLLYRYQLKETWYSSFHKLPLISNYLHKVMLASFSHQLSLTLEAGIPILEAIQLAHNSQPRLTNITSQLVSQLQSGMQLHQAMESIAFFPHFITHMCRIGEESGTLPQMLKKTAQFYESDIQYLLKRFSQNLEPLIILVLGVLIGGLVISMYLPIFKLGSTL